MTDDQEFIIRIRGLVTSFGDHIIHDDLTLDVRRGEVIGLVGGSGSGKSVLLRSIVRLKDPDDGSIKIFGKQLELMTEEEILEVEKRWGVLFQDGALFSSLTVKQNIQVPMREHHELPQSLMDELAMLKIDMVGLPKDAADLYPSELSGGMRKRAGLARALALDPEILFLDEPTAGLDPIGAAAFDELINNLSDTLGFTVFIVTHDLDTLYAICDRVAVLGEKKIIAIGTVKELESNDYPWIRDYFLGPRGRAAQKASERH